MLQQTVWLKDRRRRGATLVYIICLAPVMLAFCAIGVDIGRMQVAKTEVQSVADAAARYAARGMATSSTPLETAQANAAAVVAQSKVDGATPTLTVSEVVRGNYTASNKTFTADSDGNTLQITVRQKLVRPGSMPMFISIFKKQDDAEVRATAIARFSASTIEIDPPAAGNLWLSGMPYNTTTQNFRPDNSTVWDNSGTSSNRKQRPLEIDLADNGLQAGDMISLEGISGTASWVTSGGSNSADGDTSFIVANGVAPAGSLPSTNSNGMSNTRAPIGAVMAVFLSDDAPNSGSTPSNLDFGTATQRNYSTINPELKQVFYIGDGKRSNGEVQSIKVPPGATRVFFGMMDAWQWNDNSGNFRTKLYSQTSVYLVK